MKTYLFWAPVYFDLPSHFQRTVFDRTRISVPWLKLVATGYTTTHIRHRHNWTTKTINKRNIAENWHNNGKWIKLRKRRREMYDSSFTVCWTGWLSDFAWRNSRTCISIFSHHHNSPVSQCNILHHIPPGNCSVCVCVCLFFVHFKSTLNMSSSSIINVCVQLSISSVNCVKAGENQNPICIKLSIKSNRLIKIRVHSETKKRICALRTCARTNSKNN